MSEVVVAGCGLIKEWHTFKGRGGAAVIERGRRGKMEGETGMPR